MGRGSKKRGPARARENTIAEDALVSMQRNVSQENMQRKPDDSLFLVDTTGSKRERRMVEREPKPDRCFSKAEERRIGKYMAKETLSGPRKAAAVEDMIDPWAESTLEVHGANAGRAAARRMEARRGAARVLRTSTACHPGQSYNPTPEDHEDILAAAVALELKREDAIQDAAQPLSQATAMPGEPQALHGEEDGESSVDEDAEGAMTGRVQKGKLTRAERNKQKRRKAVLVQQKEQRRSKVLLKAVDKVPHLVQELEAEQEETKVRREVRAHLKKKGKVTLETNHDIIAKPSIPVNLSEELHGSLRQLKGQGSVLLETVGRLKDSKVHPDAMKAKNRARARPGFRKKNKFVDRHK